MKPVSGEEQAAGALQKEKEVPTSGKCQLQSESLARFHQLMSVSLECTNQQVEGIQFPEFT